MTPTDAQIEAIARAHCGHMGENPDENCVWNGSEWFTRVEMMANEIRHRLAMDAAIKEVLG